MGPRILIAEDEPAIRDLLTRIVRRAGIDAVAVENGRAALDELRRSEYDVLLLDLTMPRVSGYDVVNDLRGWRNRPAVIVLTANAREDGRHLDGTVVLCIVTKPFDVNMLVELLSAVAGAVRAAREKRTWTPPPPVEHFAYLFE
jgi:DNA-binding response OmpR family regulator